MKEGHFNYLPNPIDLFLHPPDIGVSDIRLLLNLHHCNCWINFRRQGIWIWYFLSDQPRLVFLLQYQSGQPSFQVQLQISRIASRKSRIACPHPSPFSIIFVQRATWSDCSSWTRRRSAGKSHKLAGASPVSLSLTPNLSLILFKTSWMSFSTNLISPANGPCP